MNDMLWGFGFVALGALGWWQVRAVRGNAMAKERTMALFTAAEFRADAAQNFDETDTALEAERSRYAFEASGDAWWDWRIDADRFEYETRWAEALGCRSAGSRFVEFEALVHKEDRLEWHAALRPCLIEGAERFRAAFRLLRASGDYRWMLARGKVVERDAKGRPLRLVGSISDIEEQRGAEAALREAEQRWQYALEGSDTGVWDWDLRSGRVFRSDRWHEQLGYKREEIKPEASAWEALVHPEDLPRVLLERQRHFNGESPVFATELRIRHRNGHYLWVQIRGRVIARGLHGEALRIIGTQADISQRRRAAQALAQSERRYRSLVELSPDGIARISEGRVQYVNEAFLRMLGASSAEEVIGREFAELFDESEHAEVRARILVMNEGREGEIGGMAEYILRTMGGAPLDVDMRAAGFNWRDRRIVQVVVRDVTVRRRMHRQVVQLNSELERRVRERTADLEAANRELEAFSYSVAHDLRAPLRAIEAYTRILEEEHGPALPAGAIQYFDRVRVNATRMSHLIDDLLALARVGRRGLTTQEVDMRRLATVVLEEVRAAYPPCDILIGSLPLVQGDPVLLHQVLTNLLDNALKFSARAQSPRVELDCETTPEEYVFRVRDSGVGFEMSYAQKLFGVFQRLHSSSEYEGTGVGLAIVQRAMQRLRGRVWAEGRPGQGASFYFALPRTSRTLGHS